MNQDQSETTTASLLSAHSILQTHPDLLVWPGTDLQYVLLRSEAQGPLTFHFPPDAARLLLRFLRPTAVAEVFPQAGSDDMAVLQHCVSAGLLLACPAAVSAPPSANASRQAGFMLSELAEPLPSPDQIRQAVVRREVLGGRPIYVLDDLFSSQQVTAIHRWMQRLPYCRIDYDTESSMHVRHWICELPQVAWLIQTVPFLRTLAHLGEQLFVDEQLLLKRAHVNSSSYGDLQLPHRDAEDAAVTLLCFANPVWDAAWMGETIFYDGQGEPLYAVRPRPGRVLAFRGDLVHRAGVPSRVCHEARLNLACKFLSPARQGAADAAPAGEPAGRDAAPEGSP